jgi:hypothetical protein
MEYKVIFLGLVNFFEMTGTGGTALLPDGTDPSPFGADIPKHFASILVRSGDVSAAETTWVANEDQELTTIGVTQFLIDKPAYITMSGMEEPAAVSSSQPAVATLDTAGQAKIPMLKQIDDDFNIVLDKARTIARFPIRQGKLEASLFGGETVGGKSVVSTLTVTHAGPLTITARDDADKSIKTLTLNEGSEILIANISKVSHVNIAGAPSHFRIYAQLDENTKFDKLDEPKPDATLPNLDSHHPYLNFLLTSGGAFPAPGCSVTGCCVDGFC